MWGPQEKDWKPLRNGWGHIPWLIVLWGICVPTLPLMAMSWDMTDWYRFLIIGVGMSAWWDILYIRITDNLWMRPVPRWLVIGQTQIGWTTNRGGWIFMAVRLSILLIPPII